MIDGTPRSTRGSFFLPYVCEAVSYLPPPCASCPRAKEPAPTNRGCRLLSRRIAAGGAKPASRRVAGGRWLRGACALGGTAEPWGIGASPQDHCCGARFRQRGGSEGKSTLISASTTVRWEITLGKLHLTPIRTWEITPDTDSDPYSPDPYSPAKFRNAVRTREISWSMQQRSRASSLQDPPIQTKTGPR